VSEQAPLSQARTPDGISHKLWAIIDPDAHDQIAHDLGGRRALIADGHHRYATYRKLQGDRNGVPGPWDRGLTLLVDTSSYGPQVHPIHRVVALGWQQILELSREHAKLGEPIPVSSAEQALAAVTGFAVALTNGEQAVIVSELAPAMIERGLGEDADTALGRLDITVLHRVLVEQIWGLTDDVDNVGYAHDVTEALQATAADSHTAVLVRPTPVKAVAEVAAGGQRMPRKSTLFSPKPASGVVIRRFADQ
jgi:uncharacterized protein (DUF1015 family)